MRIKQRGEAPFEIGRGRVYHIPRRRERAAWGIERIVNRIAIARK